MSYPPISKVLDKISENAQNDHQCPKVYKEALKATAVGLLQLQNILEKLGWSRYYNENYWVHKKTVKDHSSQDYTNYGMGLFEAIAYELEHRGPMPGHPLAGLMGSGAILNNFGKKSQ